MSIRFALIPTTLALACAAAPAAAIDAGVPGTKLVIVDKIAATGKAKTVFVTKGDPDIQKGVDGDPALLEGSLEVFYTCEAEQHFVRVQQRQRKPGTRRSPPA